MALTKLTTTLNKISSLATTIRGQATTVKAAFDYDVNVVKDFINDTLTEEADALDAENVKLTGDQTLDGIKTFTSSPIVPTPTADLHASTKKYVDDNYTSKNEITTNRKLSANGDFSGTWNGHKMVETDPGIQTEVNQRLVIGNDYRPSVLVNGSFQVPMPVTEGFGLSIWNAWAVYSALATVSVSQLPTGGARISNSTRDRNLTNIHQNITIPTELKGKTITLSVKIKCSVTNQYARIAIVYGDDESHVIGFITPTLNTTDTVYTVTCSIPLDTSSIKVGICLSARFTDVGSHPWGINGTYFEACDVDISWMKLEVNDHATPFIPKSYKQELLACSDNLGVAPNILINGDFRVWQRGVSFLSLDSGYSADRWHIGNSGDANIKITKGTGSASGFRIEEYSAVGNATAYTTISQFIEDYASLVNKRVTLSVQVTLDSGVAPAILFIADSTKTVSIDIPSSGVYTISSTIDSNTSMIRVGVQFNRQNLAVGKGLTIKWIKLEVCDHATPFIPKSYGEELLACQRYYQSVIAVPNIATSQRTSGIYLPGQRFNVQMRVAPVVTIMSMNGTVGKISSSTTGQDVSDGCFALTVSTDRFSFVKSTTSIPDDSIGYQYSFTADAEI